MSKSKKIEIPALINNQWLNSWDNVLFDSLKLRTKPQPYFYVFSIKASWLRQLSKVYARKANKKRIDDTAIQRAHDPNRSKKIFSYIIGGFPWSDLKEDQQGSADYNDHKMPGWLPTAIIANILTAETKRGSSVISNEDLIEISAIENKSCKIILPEKFLEKKWDPKVPPIEIIDGQHRLWAFDSIKNSNVANDYELPVVAFHGLDVVWQAYLFYTINIKPKKINQSLAFDLYPLLRIQEWLEKAPLGSSIYRDTRAQEITEILWTYKRSPWYKKINMLGESNNASVSQAAFIRSIAASFLRVTKKKGVGGLFSHELRNDKVLNWSRTQQTAFVVLAWNLLKQSIKNSKEKWATSLRSAQDSLFDSSEDEAFYGKYSMINSDQGVRGFMMVVNDMCFQASKQLSFDLQAELSLEEESVDEKELGNVVKFFQNHELYEFLKDITSSVSKFDWRTSSFQRLSDKEKKSQLVYRGGSGYKELRSELLKLLLKESKNKVVKKTAAELIKLKD
ncbi:MAG: DGQHR domain-containing protein [Bacteroidota bacterium]|nr:DGQHR domain-containing protein [Bacteroidota bacterium]